MCHIESDMLYLFLKPAYVTYTDIYTIRCAILSFYKICGIFIPRIRCGYQHITKFLLAIACSLCSKSCINYCDGVR